MRRVVVVSCVLVGVVIVTALVGYVYVRTSPAWGAIGMFADDRRADSFRSMHELFPAHAVAASDDVWSFAQGERALPETYRYAGDDRPLAEFLAASETTGLLVVVDGTIVHETYAAGYDEHSLVTSFSVAKSVISGLVGVAIDRGYIDSVDDAISAYVPELEGSGYDGVAIRDVLTMSSGVAFDERYDRADSDVMRLPVQIYLFRRSVPSILAHLERAREPGTVHEYVSSDALALGLLVARATGRPVARFLEETIWGPAGMASAAAWNTDLHGNELAHGFLSATLRDYARFGRLIVNDGWRDDREVIPRAWVHASLTSDAQHLQPGTGSLGSAPFGYGYQWWMPPGFEGDAVAMGIWGQFLYVDRTHGVVIVKTSTDAGFGARFPASVAAFRAIARAVAASDDGAVERTR